MSSKANNASGGSRTQRYAGGRRNIARRGDGMKSRKGDEQPAAAATAEERNNTPTVGAKTAKTAKTAKATATATATTSRAEQRTHNSRNAGRPQELDEAKLHRQDTAASTSSSRALNAFSPAFVPKQYQPSSQQVGSGEVNNALSFSSPSPLAYMGSNGAASSVSSPLVFIASGTHARPSITSPTTPSLSEQPTSALLPPHATSATASAGGVSSSSSAIQLRDAYARAAAAKAASTNRDPRSVSLISQLLPLQQQQQQPSPAPSLGTGAACTFTSAESTVSTLPAPQPQLPVSQLQQRPPQQTPGPPPRSSAHDTVAAAGPAGAMPAASSAVYGPSVSVFHPQFIDIATGNTSMTPFALRDDYVDDFMEAAAAETAMEGEAVAMAQEIIDGAPQPLHDRQQQQQQQQQLHPAPPRRVNATTVAILASRNAPTAQLAMPASTAGRGERVVAVPPPSMCASASMAGQLVSEAAEESVAMVTARPTPSLSQRRTTTVLTSTTATPASAANVREEETAFCQETPQRQTATHTNGFGDAKGNSSGTTSSLAVADGGANTVERLYACLANTDERTEDGRSVTSKMGLTGSVRRGAQPRRNARDDDDEDRSEKAEGKEEGEGVDGVQSTAETPTVTPAKVLAVEGSPFVAAVAADSTTTGAAPPSSPLPSRRLLTEEDSAIVFLESSLGESMRGSRAQLQNAAASHSTSSSTSNSIANAHSTAVSNAQLQRAMMQLIAQIQSNNSKAAATAANTAAAAGAAPKTTTTTTTTVIMATPQKSSANSQAQSETTPASFKTPEIERVPSARPSASKNSTCRTITTIIHTPNTTTTTNAHSYSNSISTATDAAVKSKNVTKREVSSTPKNTQRSLASCLEAIAPAAKITTTRPCGSTASEEAESSHVNPNAMPVPRSQRRTTRHGGSNDAAANASAPINNDSVASNPQTTIIPTTTTHTMRATSPLLTSLASSAPVTQYAVVIDGHMGRRVTAVSRTPLKAGVCVLFEEDRGIDMGRVVQCDLLEDDDAVNALPTLASATSPLSRKDRPAPVLRPATAEEEYRWLYADVKEAEATLEPCREAAARLGLPVKVVGAVYQFNKAKLTFYYESSARVDFRPLLPSLFSRFHCRIWMARMETPAVEEA